MAKKYDLDADLVPRKESQAFSPVDDAESAVTAIWKNAVNVVKETGGHRPVLFVFEPAAVMVIAVESFFENAETRMNFMQFVREIALTRDNVEGVVLAMESQYLDIGMVGQDVKNDAAKRSLVVMAEWRTGEDCAKRADLFEIEGAVAVGKQEDLPGRGLHEFGGVFK